MPYRTLASFKILSRSIQCWKCYVWCLRASCWGQSQAQHWVMPPLTLSLGAAELGSCSSGATRAHKQAWDRTGATFPWQCGRSCCLGTQPFLHSPSTTLCPHLSLHFGRRSPSAASSRLLLSLLAAKRHVLRYGEAWSQPCLIHLYVAYLQYLVTFLMSADISGCNVFRINKCH